MECSRFFFVNCDDASFTFSFGNGTIFCFHLNESTGSIKCFPLKMLYCLHFWHPFCLPFRPLFPFYFFSWIQCNVVVSNRTLIPPTFLQIFTFIIRLTDNLRQFFRNLLVSSITRSHRFLNKEAINCDFAMPIRNSITINMQTVEVVKQAKYVDNRF